MSQLAPLVFVAPVRDRAVALDLARDRYVALGPRLAAAALELSGRAPEAPLRPAELSAARAALVAGGLAGDVGLGGALSTQAAAVPTETLWPRCGFPGDRPPRIRPLAAVGALRALAQVQNFLSRRTFVDTIARVAREPVRSTPAARSEQTLLDEFGAVRPWFPVKPVCRLDALALCLYLRRNGHPAQLVFGVRLEPFRAHCWVQTGDRTLNEAHDLAARFSPILVV